MCRKPLLAATALIWALAGHALAADPTAAPNAQTAPAAPAPGKATPPKPARKASAEERADAERLEPLARAAFWAHEVTIDPTDSVAGVHLASALRALKQYPEAIGAASQVLVVHPDNLDALLEAARAQIGQDQAFYAIEPLKHAEKVAPRDWRAPSLMGVALQQVRRYDDADTAWRQALALSPDNPAVLSNMAMALADRGQAAQAEPLLRKAVAQPGASLQVRQNLTLVLGLQGKLGEAEKLLREDLPPDQADANLAYLQALTAQPSPQRTPAAAGAPPSAHSRQTVKGDGS